MKVSEISLFPSMIKTISPFISSITSRISLAVPCKYSSYFLVSSLAKHILRVGINSEIISNVSLMRCGDSYIINVSSKSFNFSSSFFLLLSLLFRKPTKYIFLEDIPLPTRALTNALGPGITTTSMDLLIASNTATYPGSLIIGIPASLTTATFLPSSM